MRPRSRLSSRFIDCFARTGFANVAISEETIRDIHIVFQSASKFFKECNPQKMLAKLPDDSGYRPLGIEYSQTPSRPDQMESFTISHRNPRMHAPVPHALAEDLRVTMLNIFNIIESIVEQITIDLMSRIADSAVSKRVISGSFRDWSLLQLNYSRPRSVAAEYINDLHEDGCLVSVMVTTGPGLELQRSDGSFISAEPTNEFLFMAGEILSLLSGGQIPAIYHRVRPMPQLDERMSLVFFADMDPSRCAPWIANSFNAGVNIGERVLSNSTRYGLSSWKS